MPTIDHPSHYQSAGIHGAAGNIEVIDVIEAYGLVASFCLGNALKYLLRGGKKGTLVADLEKAKWYVQRHEQAATSGDLYEPMARDDASDTLDVDTVCDAFALTGQRRFAVELLLGWAAYGIDDEMQDFIADGLDPDACSECDVIVATIDLAIVEAKA